ncbi:flagellar L-ring protein precursor FlgH [Pseudooceanicola antarcticus]|uniref:Flagellar L-ring protein n=1 Tax=Pseudooceanicola antarcticus TaxID=1247613 RepID=A0A285HZ19_9RHOB|nr:flagellar basal body L-ring protein FlgH [Pseudooceanicola antarcticus]PJE27404.1 flagellar basal body L-ring protein FlgH [Pseudooceanicola antarcticus]SNY39951.1 flagellar L-ring protein precursor FlgH [Pseudooceanicola antarcticus]
MKRAALILAILGLSGCIDRAHLGEPPKFSPDVHTPEYRAMMHGSEKGATLPYAAEAPESSLWRGGRRSLLGDRRAMNEGDILTVVIEIDESAAISNSSDRSRSGSDSLAVPQLFGIPQRINRILQNDATLDSAVSIDSSSSASGDGSVSRNEQLTLRVAATVVDVLPNGVLAISGNQEVRVNFELRELLVSGYVRPEDISRQNEITYDKIASARVSYGGRGQISDMQQPRIGQQVLDRVLPF